MASGCPLLEAIKIGLRVRIDRNYYRVTLTTVAQTIRPSLPVEIIDDDDVALLLHREHVDPLVCISVKQINDDHPEVKHNFHLESPHCPHHATEYDFQHTADMPNTNAHLDDIRKVAPRPVDMCIAMGELFESKQQLQSQLGRLEYLTMSTHVPMKHDFRIRDKQAHGVIGEHIKKKFCDHRLYKSKEIIQDIQKEFGISCNYHKAYIAKHIALDEV
ncbi:hypothetical protein Ddye_004351 [Dipteronia dyeriana]|uniref:Uncharacterized protein n=1 Tax=Dipteronia dyeriana TaxID=168575 RepID=A0AAD9XVB3_9ROSI|nr:hypothetical protein Ddye_004351 [Dipteronia dyeriana]